MTYVADGKHLPLAGARITIASEKRYVKPALMPAVEWGALIAKDEAKPEKLMQIIGLKTIKSNDIP